VQIRALRPSGADERIWTIFDKGIPMGRAWNRNGSAFYFLQSVSGRGTSAGPADKKTEAEEMFRLAERLLKSEGTSYRDVVRTWIYISDILGWYGDFNEARNRCYSDFGFLGNDSSHEAEQIYLPASTGIEGKNPSGGSVVMDCFAVRRQPGSTVQVRPITGLKQRSPFRYGSAFSRAMSIDDSESRLVLVSGTASIDESGKSVHIGDVRAQIRHTLDVVSALIASEGASLSDLCEATVFLKRSEDLPVYLEAAEQYRLSSAPSVFVTADVCRDELLFELDAAFLVDKGK
jgi:enamine deaminase RidA (YjgF/YER057c/UK114 family)